MLVSVTRGAILGSCIALVLALPRSTELPAALWIALLVVTHAALPVASAFWGRRADAVTFDAGLAVIGLAYIGLLLLSPNASGWLYGGAPVGYAMYAFVATLAFVGIARWRTALRVRGLARLRDEARARHRSQEATVG